MMWSKSKHRMWKHKKRIEKRLIQKTSELIGVENTPENREKLKRVVNSQLSRELK